MYMYGRTQGGAFALSWLKANNWYFSNKEI